MNFMKKIMQKPLFDAYDSDQKDIIEYTLVSLGIGLLFALINIHLLFPAFIITSTIIKPKFLARNRADIVDGKIIMANGKILTKFDLLPLRNALLFSVVGFFVMAFIFGVLLAGASSTYHLPKIEEYVMATALFSATLSVLFFRLSLIDNRLPLSGITLAGQLTATY